MFRSITTNNSCEVAAQHFRSKQYSIVPVSAVPVYTKLLLELITGLQGSYLYPQKQVLKGLLIMKMAEKRQKSKEVDWRLWFLRALTMDQSQLP